MTPIFFNPDNNAAAEEFQAVLPVNVNTSFEMLAPGLAEAERKYIRPLLGATLMATLQSYYESKSTADADKNEVIERIQATAIRICYYENMDIFAVTITDSGVQNPNGENAAYRYQVDAAKDTLGRQAFEHLQSLYEYLVAKNFSGWQPEDDRLCKRDSHLIPTYREFFDAVEMEPDYRLYQRLATTITTVEDTILPLVTGKKIANDIKVGTITESTVLKLARKVVCYHTLEQSCMMLHGILTSDGVTTRTIKAEGWRGGTNESTADNKTRLRLRKSYEEAAKTAETMLNEYFLANSSTYPTSLYVQMNGRDRLPKNDKNSKIFMA